MKNRQKKNASQLALRNVQSLKAYQINLQVYFKRKRSLWQRILGGLRHDLR